MAAGTGGRPTSDLLRNRCNGLNKAGDQCGSPAVRGTKLCRAHLGKADRKAEISARDRLTALGMKALDTLETAMDNYRVNPAEAVRAAQIICDRTFPKPASTQAVVLNMTGGAGPLDNTTSPADIIRARMAQLAASAGAGADAEPQGSGDMASVARDLQDAAWRSAPPEDPDVIDAEIIPDPPAEPEPVAVRRIS